MKRADVCVRHTLEPDGLPNPCGARIPDAMRLQPPILLAAGLFQIVGIVFYLHRDTLVTAWIERVRDVRTERRMPAFVLDHRNVIDPDACVIVDGSEVQDHPATPLARPRGIGAKFKIALIPAEAVKAGVVDAATPRLRCERHFDSQRPLANVLR